MNDFPDLRLYLYLSPEKLNIFCRFLGSSSRYALNIIKQHLNLTISSSFNNLNLTKRGVVRSNFGALQIALTAFFCKRYIQLTPGLINATKKKKLLYEQSLKYGTDSALIKYKNYKNKLTYILRCEQKRYYSRLLTEHKGDMKKKGKY